MSDLSWKIKRFLKQIFPIALIVGLVYGGYTMYRKGMFGPRIGSTVSSILHKIPYFGSRFRHYSVGSSAPSYSYAKRSYRRKMRVHRPRRHRRHHR